MSKPIGTLHYYANALKNKQNSETWSRIKVPLLKEAAHHVVASLSVCLSQSLNAVNRSSSLETVTSLFLRDRVKCTILKQEGQVAATANPSHEAEI
jgi:hypothetical protein